MKVDDKKGIAIIGMSCRFPGSNNPDEFWNLISSGQSKFTSIPPSRLKKFDFSSIKVQQGSFLDNPFDFDNSYFKISDSEAISMDPQQRIMLELALEAKENALIQDFKDRNVGVFIGANQRSYADGIISKSYRKQFADKIMDLDFFNKISNELKEDFLAEIATLVNDDICDSDTLAGNLSNIISSRISHEFNLNGPSLTIDTACSSSLVAVHLACESLHNNVCNLAYAGGVNLNLTPTIFSLMEKTGAVSPSGTCMPFSEKSDGILLGEGGALVLLKRLEDALHDGDNILSVIMGSGVNNDGRSLGIMAPSWKGQLELLETVYSKNNFDRNKIGLIEAHGTSTRIGDSVEMTVLERFFEKKGTPLYIGSVKSNIGHTMGASGIAGLIKVIMAIKFKKLPPTLFGKNLNPKWKLKEKGFYVQEKLKDWNSNNLRSVGVSSFGFGGTNAHIIIEELDSRVTKPLNKKPKYTKLKKKKFEFELYPTKNHQKESVFSLEWELSDIQEHKSNFKPEIWLLFCDKSRLVFHEHILRTDIPCITVLPGEHFTRTDDLAYTIDYKNKKHLKWLMEEIRENHPIGIVYTPLTNDKELAHRTYEELLFIRRLFNATIDSKANFRLWCISSTSHKINEQEVFSPHEHSIVTLFSSAINENRGIHGGVINLKVNSEDDMSLIPELITSQFKGPIVLRNTKTYSPKLKRISINGGRYTTSKLTDEGVYLIIGGSSGIGEEITKHIHNKFGAKLIVSGTRSKIKLSESIKSILGESIEYVQSSIIDKHQTSDLIKSVFKKHKKLNGIIVAAGTHNIGALKSISDVDFERVIRTKLFGIENLREAIKNRNVDFVYILSSASSLTPQWSYGMAAYSTSNAYVNAFAERYSTQKTQWMSRSWSIWKDIGMSKGIDTSLFKSMQPFIVSDAVELFEYSMQYKEPHLAIIQHQDSEAFSYQWSTKIDQEKNKASNGKPIQNTSSISNDAYADFRQNHKSKISEEALLNDNESSSNSNNHRQDSLSSPTFQKNDTSEIHKWETITPYLKSLIAAEVDLDISAIDENESFYNLGLDSINTLDIVSRIEKEYDISLNPTLLFEHDTIAKLAQYFIQLNNVSKAEYPLLATQKTFYSNQQFYPDLPCNCMVKISFERQFDLEVLNEAWDLVLEQNQAMNLFFEMTKEGPRQGISDTRSTKIESHRLTSIDNIADIENRMINKVYEFSDTPLFDLCYIEINESNSLLIFNAHHIVTDAWSMNLILSQLIKKYNEIDSGNLQLAPTSNNSFLNYVNHKINEKKDEKSALSSTYWSQELKDFIPFNLTDKKVLNCVGSSQKGTHNTVLIAKTSMQVENKAKSENITLFQLLISSYFKTIERFSGQGDVIINLAADNRDRTFDSIDKIAGCIADSNPLRIQILPNDSLWSIAEKVKAKLIAMGNFNSLSSMDYASLQNLRSEMGPKGISPFGMSYLNLDYFNKDSELVDTTIEARSALPFTDLSLICLKQNGRLHFTWNYSATSFSKEYIEEINTEFLGLLTDKESTLSVSKNREMDKVVLPKTTLFPNQLLLHEKVFSACDIFQNDVAIRDNATPLTYSQLKAKSIQLANTLINSRSNLSEGIGILEYPGANAAFGILGILASNCAYVPLDPDWPHQRIEAIITHSNIDVLVTSSIHFQSVVQNNDILNTLSTVVFLDDNDLDTSKHSGINFLDFSKEHETKLSKSSKDDSPDSLACIMYTSGTTGNPKGVSIKHSAVEIFLSWIAEEFEISSSDNFIATSSLGFDASIRQLFSTLLAGGEIHPIDRFDFKDPKSLLDYLEEHNITILNTVPIVVQNICDYVDLLSDNDPIPRLNNLRLILFGGDILHGKTIVKWRNIFGSSHQLFNTYGTTETIVNATFHEIKDEKSIPIGKTRKGSHILLLNEKGSTCLPGERGELFVGGPSLASGYYKDEALTIQKFVTPNVVGACGVYYRTGDLATVDGFGVYSFIGRNDNQIQLYGNRIEPSEIEAVIVNIDGISNAAVVDHKTDDSHFLVAFIEPSKENTNSHTDIEIRTIIGENLPQYMVPQKIEFVETIPLNHADKIDRVNLSYSTKIEVRNEGSEQTQEILKNIWRETLKINDIELNHDFFMIGGDSIMALQVLHSIRKNFPLAPKPVELFRNRTINQLSACIDELNNSIENQSISDSSKWHNKSIFDNETKFPLSFSQKGFLFLNKIDPNSSPILVALLPIKGELNMGVLEAAFNYLVSRHSILRTSFITEDSNTIQSVGTDNNLNIDLIDISAEPDIKQMAIINKVYEEYKRLKFNLQEPPLFKMKVLKQSKASTILIVAMHHIIGDAWSFKVLMDEFLKSYDLKLVDSNAILPELNTSFFDFILKESNAKKLTSERMIKLTDFWKGTFQALPKIDLPQESLSDSENSVPITLRFTTNQCQSLKKYSSKIGFSLFQLIFTCYARALQNTLKVKSVLINSAISGRDIPIKDVQGIIGCFARNIPVRINSLNNVFLSDLKKVENAFLNSIDHQEITPSNQIKILLENGGKIDRLSQFVISFMDFTTMDSYASTNIEFDLNGSDFFFNAGSASSDLMLGIRVGDELIINLNGKAHLEIKNLVINSIQDQLIGMIGLLEETTEVGLSKNLNQIDSALIAYFPSFDSISDFFPSKKKKSEVAKAFIDRLMPNTKPKLLEIEDTNFGNAGIVFLPLLADELFKLGKDKLLDLIMSAVDVASQHGAKHISLAGNLASLTNYGYSVTEKLDEVKVQNRDITITTGHTCTVVSVVKTIEKVIKELNLDLTTITVGVAGYGSIGQASLDLLIEKLGAPAKIIIADLASQLSYLDQTIKALRKRYPITIEIIGVTGEMPKEFYSSNIIIGSSSKGQILDVDKFLPGTILADDSFPHIIDTQKAVKRMKDDKDVLVVGAGKINVGQRGRRLVGWPFSKEIVNKILNKLGDEGLPGCLAESIFMSYDKSLPSTIGLVSTSNALVYWDKLSDLDMHSVNFHLQGYKIEESLINKLKKIKRTGESGKNHAKIY